VLVIRPIIDGTGGADKVAAYVFELHDRDFRAVKIKLKPKERTFRLTGEAALAATRWWKANKEGFLGGE
jgi:hypothetical protein